jgi:uncharacterized protein
VSEPASGSAGKHGPPPKWKFAVVVLLGLYPLLIIVLPLLARVFGRPIDFGAAFLARTLLTVLIVVPLMVWGAIPLLSRLLHTWLHT